MGLSDDQRALLRLLARREEGYEDIAALMGLSVDEVRARVREALAGLDEERSPAGPVTEGGPPTKRPEGAPSAPPAEETAPPAARAARAAQPPAPARPAASSPKARSAAGMALPKDRRRLVELIGGALVAILLLLFATGTVDIGGGGDSDSDTTTMGSRSEPPTTTANAALTQAILEPVDGGEASGRALFGRLGKNVVLQIEAQGLDPSPQGQSYTVWLARSPRMMVPLGTAKVGADGRLAARLQVPAAVLVLLAQGVVDEIAVSLTSDAALGAAVRKGREENREPSYTGTDVLRGDVTGPIVGSGRASRR